METSPILNHLNLLIMKKCIEFWHLKGSNVEGPWVQVKKKRNLTLILFIYLSVLPTTGCWKLVKFLLKTLCEKLIMGWLPSIVPYVIAWISVLVRLGLQLVLLRFKEVFNDSNNQFIQFLLQLGHITVERPKRQGRNNKGCNYH